MVSRRKKHKNAQIRAARQRKRERERMKAWYERQKKWKTKDRIYFYLSIVCVICALGLLIYMFGSAIKEIF
jgi:hypothetical protein